MTVTTENELPATEDESLEDLQARSRAGGNELDPEDFTEDGSEELTDLDLPYGELDIKVVPQQADEFTCTSCFLVRHRAQRSEPTSSTCYECA